MRLRPPTSSFHLLFVLDPPSTTQNFTTDKPCAPQGSQEFEKTFLNCKRSNCSPNLKLIVHSLPLQMFIVLSTLYTSNCTSGRFRFEKIFRVITENKDGTGFQFLTLSVLTSTKVDTRGPVLKSTKVDIQGSSAMSIKVETHSQRYAAKPVYIHIQHWEQNVKKIIQHRKS